MFVTYPTNLTENGLRYASGPILQHQLRYIYMIKKYQVIEWSIKQAMAWLTY